jgi:hypothetical protein
MRLSKSKYVNINSQKIIGMQLVDASDQPTPGVIITFNDLLSYTLDVCK